MTSVTRGTGAGATVANPDGGSQAVWSNTSLITADEGYYATLQLSHVYGETGYNYLKASDFGFSIASDQQIDGIEVIVERQRVAGGSFGVTSLIKDDEILILNGDGSAGVGSTNRSADAEWSTSWTDVTFGSSSDNWGETWTPAKVNSSDFGVYIRCKGPFDPGGAASWGEYAYVDHVEITIHHSDAASEGNPAFLLFLE
tara:strand:+ start:691 stop:1290 length:600 start_codon:yes stop_codon:yes gene_type:complete